MEVYGPKQVGLPRFGKLDDVFGEYAEQMAPPSKKESWESNEFLEKQGIKEVKPQKQKKHGSFFLQSALSGKSFGYHLEYHILLFANFWPHSFHSTNSNTKLIIVIQLQGPLLQFLFINEK